jgi:hypothetical protein
VGVVVTIPWVPVVEQMPAEKTVVIVGQTTIDGGYRIFAGWLADGVWYCFHPKHPNALVEMHDATQDSGFVANMGDLRAGDFWLTLPEWPPGHGVVRGGYPA